MSAHPDPERDLLVASVPRYWLYGEPPAVPELRFVHIETIPDRMRLHNWEVRPHRHDGLSHALLVTAGGGWVTVDGVETSFRAPAFLAIPAQVVHGFRFDPATDGHVLTLSEGFLAAVLNASPEGEMRTALALPIACDLVAGAQDETDLTRAFTDIGREFHGHRPGRADAIAAHVMLILVAALRLVMRRRRGGSDLAGHGPSAEISAEVYLLARLKPLIDRRFREHWTVGRYAGELGVTPGRLNAACRRVTGLSTLQLVHARLMLEAKRSLIYTGHGMAEVGYALGFADPAYFSRFFTKREGCSPLAFRRAREARSSTPVAGGRLDGNDLDRPGEGSPQ
ncbi:helix-turn-helix domain-containing protein [Azospirillum picis]|uniref:AraC family transcriptional activator of pobA n=1 Tax=Azospirillum picis TaxID=488438 RepID=A0ABU0MDY8_9PROT|nr:helix-turn-helix domain-containing protein [Azospirillum picis]MBP2297355.1 AraC family transcriptional activator of pobA [Azospirillum picis]MDQ0531622.1 AraC family transcriptional activator of pobA [Azospirillum picis]